MGSIAGTWSTCTWTNLVTFSAAATPPKQEPIFDLAVQTPLKAFCSLLWITTVCDYSSPAWPTTYLSAPKASPSTTSTEASWFANPHAAFSHSPPSRPAHVFRRIARQCQEGLNHAPFSLNRATLFWPSVRLHLHRHTTQPQDALVLVAGFPSPAIALPSRPTAP